MAEDNDVINITEQDLADGERQKPDIVINEADLRQPQPNLVINYRDTARNPIEWLGGAIKDVKTKVRNFAENRNWWGLGESGRRKQEAFRKSEQERLDVEELTRQINIVPDKKWEEMTDKELSELEIRLINEKQPKDEITLDVEDIEAHERGENITQGKLSEKELWDRYKKERKEFLETQSKAVSEIYAREGFQTPIVMENHIRQKYIGNEGIYSCFVASSLNALHALGVARENENEDSIIAQMGGRGVFGQDGYLPIGRAKGFLEGRNLSVTQSGNMLELLQTLENGGVALIAYGGHARMISGAEAENGEVLLREHDPLNKTEAERVPIRGIVERINQTESMYSMLLIEKQPS